MVGLLNTICVEIFKIVVIFEGCRTYMEESLQQLKRIVAVQYINIAIVLLFAQFSFGYSADDLGLIILVGIYRDFDSPWYFDVGAKICVACLTNCFASFFSKLFEGPVQWVIRWLNRGFKKHLRKLQNFIDKKNEELEKNEKEARDKHDKEHADAVAKKKASR